MVNTQQRIALHDNVKWQIENYFKITKRNFMQQDNFNKVDPAKLQAQTEYMFAKGAFKKEIAEAVQKQKALRNHMTGEYSREEQSRAQSHHAINGFDLRCMYIAYSIFRHTYGEGYTKEPEHGLILKGTVGNITDIVVPANRRPVSAKYINELIQKYVPKTVYTG
jgi:hypothetical protein